MPSLWTDFTRSAVEPVLARCHSLKHRAMNTGFEILIDHPDPKYARQAARAAFDELDRLETVLSRYVDGSDISRLNAAPAGQPIRMGADTLECLSASVSLLQLTRGAFDISIGSGLDTVRIDRETCCVAKASSETRMDLGGIGKGYALDRLGELLREWEIERACLIGGGSSILALNPPGGLPGWPVGVGTGDGAFKVFLHRSSMSASGTAARGEHIRDPASPDRRLPSRRTWACSRTATWSDALATAIMVMEPDGIAKLETAEGAAGMIEEYSPAGVQRMHFGNPRLRSNAG